MKTLTIALALAALYPAPAGSPPVVRAAAPAEQREGQPAEPPAWLLVLVGAVAIGLMRRPLR